jgi:DNA-binding transcriptional ArsR family regulator
MKDLKDNFPKMAFRSQVEMTDPAVIRAVAHPTRMAILAFLADGPATATECSHAADESPSSCSYHLRTLAKLGFVEEVASDDKRERRWRLAIQDVGIPKSAQDSAAVLKASLPWGQQWVAIEQRVLARYLADQDGEPKEWQKAATFTSSQVHLTPAELIELGEQVSALLEPYVEREHRGSPPRRARPVRVVLTAFPRPSDVVQRRR